MNVLIVPSRFPSKYQPNNYSFVKDQVEALAEQVDVVVAGVIPVSFRFFFTKRFSIGKIAHIPISNSVSYFLYFPSIPKLLLLNELVRYILNRMLIKKIRSRHKFDVIHFHSVWSATIGGWFYKRLNIPYCITEHSSLFLSDTGNTNRLIAKKAFRDSKAVIAVSKTLARSLERNFGIEPLIVPNLVDTNFFSPVKVCLDSPDKIFTTVGNLVDVKNHESLILAFNKFLKMEPLSKLNIVGSGPNFDKLKSLISALKIETSVVLLGYLKKDEIRNVLEDSNYFVMPSVHETFGVAVIEAMSMGLPVLCTKFGGVSDDLVDVDGCVLVDNNIEALVVGLTVLSKLKRSKAIRNFVLKNYSSTNVSSKLREIYETMQRNSESTGK